MAESGSRLHGDLYAMVSARTMAASVCKLLLEETGDSSRVVKSRLRQLRELDFKCPSEDDITLENLPVLPKNTAKNFLETFFKDFGTLLVEREKLRMKEQIRMKAEAYAQEVLRRPEGSVEPLGETSVDPPAAFVVEPASTFEDRDTTSGKAEGSTSQGDVAVEPAMAEDVGAADPDNAAAAEEV
ncbi:hypothetical protein C2845_PM09G15860 [Panicum miliaceum]|uniref:Uncharacterized protein n=1 Tax=Panicum miliaceum TaxID=4540 RepID=A0A3L6S2Y8_PANMI|nr:hypothetical protein C2845_PM09G15860 [Panicum miliaceum]